MMGTTLGALLVWAAPAVSAQAAPSGQTSQSQTQDKAAAKNSSKPATLLPAKQTGAAQQPAKGSSTTAQSPASQTPAKNSAKPATPQPSKQPGGGAQQPAKAASATTQASKSQGPAKSDAKAPQKTSASTQPAKTGAGPAKGQETTAAKAPAKPPAKASKQAAKKAAPSTASTSTAEGKKKPEPKPKKASAKPAPPSGEATGQKEEPKIARRDPFESLVGRERTGDTGPRLPGKAGLVISQLRLDGVVRYVDGMIAVVTNPQSRTYFLREGDQLYDGRVAKINMDGVTFHEVGKDAFGKPVEREVSKRMYPSPGETQ
jgi:hypothetical protein